MKDQKSHTNQQKETHLAVIMEGFFTFAAPDFNFKLVNIQDIHLAENNFRDFLGSFNMNT